MHCILFTLYIICIKQWLDKKTGKPVQSWLKMRRINIKEIVGVLEGRIGIVLPAVLADECLILVGLGVFVRTKKQHMLKKMR